MTLYELAPADVSDLLTLITSPSLTIQANNAPRLAQLQAKLATLKPTGHDKCHGCEVCAKAMSETLEELDAAKKELEVTRGALEATERQRQEWIERATCAERTHADDDMAERPSTPIPL